MALEASSLNAALSTPLVLPASIAGVLAALLVVLALLAWRRAGDEAIRLLLPVVAVAMVALAVIAVLDRMAQDETAAERRALIARDSELTARALAPGSMLGCLDASAGEAVEAPCEKAVFADPRSAAGAAAYVGARLTLLADATAFARRADPAFADRFAGVRRSIELDRFGIAAHVLARRDGCTPEHCPAFALIGDASALKANMHVDVFSEYVTRYAAAWDKLPAAERPVASAAPTDVPPALPPSADAAERPPGVAVPVPSKYDFPSAASIPPVSIMNAEPPRPPDNAAAAASPTGAPVASPPVPPKRPQPQAATPPAR
jgi:hypothetical protein